MDYQSFVPIDGDEYCAYQVRVYEAVSEVVSERAYNIKLEVLIKFWFTI